MNEHERFLATRTRRIPGLPDMGWIEGKSILVTGGTGCIGSRLIRELSRHHPARLASVSRAPGLSPWPKIRGVDYLGADIRHYANLLAAFQGRKWDAVFHAAAQRDPGLAEHHVHGTVTTNVFGSANVLRACEAREVPRVVFASTGKAFRYYSPDTYTATKRIAEYLLATSAVPVRAGVRFTHVADNSIFYERLARWCHYGQPVRLHGRDIWFYIQSAAEAAELLMGAAAVCMPAPQIHAITDLGMPLSLYDLAVQAREAMASDSPIVVTGYDAGYEKVPFPGLSVPLTAGGVSPLVNAFEAAGSWQPYPGVDAAALNFPGPQISLAGLRNACCPRAGVPDSCGIRAAMHEVSWAIMRSAVAAAPLETVRRVAALCKQYQPLASPHDEMLAIIAETAGMSASAR
jgi:nucleoside-diphosphate-sugar epimerase